MQFTLDRGGPCDESNFLYGGKTGNNEGTHAFSPLVLEEHNLDYDTSFGDALKVGVDEMIGRTDRIQKVFDLCESTCAIPNAVERSNYTDTSHT